MNYKDFRKQMADTMLERDIQRAIIEWMNYNGFKVIRINSGQAKVQDEDKEGNINHRRIMLAPSGTPDVIGCYKKTGRMVLVEIKRPGRRAKKNQQLIMDDWKKAGAYVFVATSIEDVKKEIVNL